MEFSKAKMKEVIGTQTDKRVSDRAAKSLDSILQSYGKDISEKAIEIADKKDRVTVRAEDIREVLQK